MPGVQEINTAIEAIRSTPGLGVDVLPLHANLTVEEQRRVFQSTARRKVVVATNVAEVCQHFKVCRSAMLMIQ